MLSVLKVFASAFSLKHWPLNKNAGNLLSFLLPLYLFCFGALITKQYQSAASAHKSQLFFTIMCIGPLFDHFTMATNQTSNALYHRVHTHSITHARFKRIITHKRRKDTTPTPAARAAGRGAGSREGPGHRSISPRSSAAGDSRGAAVGKSMDTLMKFLKVSGCSLHSQSCCS